MPFDFITDPEQRAKAEAEMNAALEKTKSELESSINSKIEEATAGLRNSQQKLLDEKKKIQEKYKDITDPDEALRALQLISGNEEVKLLAEGKFDEVVQRRLSKKMEEHEQSMIDLQGKFDTSEMNRVKYKSMYDELLVEIALKNAAVKAGVLPTALEDILNKGRKIFSVNSEDEVTVEARDKNGNLRKIEDDKVLDPDNWINSLKTTSPHYWAGSKSADFTPGGGGGDDLDAQIAAAARAGDHAKFRKLRDKQRKIKSGQ